MPCSRSSSTHEKSPSPLSRDRINYPAPLRPTMFANQSKSLIASEFVARCCHPNCPIYLCSFFEVETFLVIFKQCARLLPKIVVSFHPLVVNPGHKKGYYVLLGRWPGHTYFKLVTHTKFLPKVKPHRRSSSNKTTCEFLYGWWCYTTAGLMKNNSLHHCFAMLGGQMTE